jgi:hypothetical protein
MTMGTQMFMATLVLTVTKEIKQVPIDRKIRQYSIFIVLNSTQTFLKE